MGSGASVEQDQQHQNLPAQNNIFIDEGVGIEQSQLSRKWTTKMTMFKNLETKNFMESQFQNKSPRQTIKLEQKPSVVYSDDSDQISKSSSESAKSSKMQISYQKKKIQHNSDNEEESDIEEKQLHNDRRQTKFQIFQSDDSFEEENVQTKLIKEYIQQAQENISSRKSSINSKSDQQFLQNFDLDTIADKLNLVKQSLPQNYPANQIYIRTIISDQKLQPGKDKLVKLACRQIQNEDNQNDLLRDDDENQSKSDIQTDYSPEQLLNQIGIAITCKKGNKNDAAPLASDYLIYNDNYQKVIILSNGHGEFGEQISNLAYRMVFHYLIRQETFYTKPLRCLQIIFKKLQNKLKMYIEKKKLEDTHNILLSGCVITVIVQKDFKLYCAQLGDNRAYIYKEHTNNNKQNKMIVEILEVHTPVDINEKARIFNSGGEVRKNPQGEEYVYVRGRLYPQLHLTRSLGDVIAHVIGVSSEPYFKEYDITNLDNFLILSTSPVFSFQDQNDIMNHLSGFSLNDIKSACESLYKQCKSSWILSEGIYDYYIIMAWLIKRAKMINFNLRKPRLLSPLKKNSEIKNFQYLCDNDYTEQSQIYQEQKFGQRSPKKFLVDKQTIGISNQEIESPKLIEKIPKSQITFQKVVLTEKYAVMLTFTTFTIKFLNFIRQLNFEETIQLMHLESIEIINKYLCENLQLNNNENLDIIIQEHQDLFSKYEIPNSPTIINVQEVGMIQIEYPKLQAYFQDSCQCEDIYLTNTDVLHLIGNKFCTIQQYCQRIDFGKQRSFIRQYHDQRIKQIGIDIYDSSTLKQLQIKQSKFMIDLNQKCLKQVCETDQKYVILTLKPPELILKQLKKTIFKQSFTLLEFLHFCFMLQKIQLETFLIMIKLQKQDGKYKFVYDLKEFPISNELSQSCLKNGLQAKINKSVQHDLHYFKLEYVPFRITIYDPLEVKEYEMPIDFNIVEQIIILKLNVEFKIY